MDISKLSEPVKVIEGDNVLLECIASDPNSTIFWTKDGADTSYSHSREIPQIQVADEGMYNCQAIRLDEESKTERNENRQVFLEVLFPPSLPKIKPEFTKGPRSALHGEYINLVCFSEAKPAPNYQWRRDYLKGQLITRNATYNLKVDSYNIEYYCIVQNRMVPTYGKPRTTVQTGRLYIPVYIKAYILKIENGIYRYIN